MVKELIEKRQRLHEENAALLAKTVKEGRDVLTPDEESEWQGRDAAIDALTTPELAARIARAFDQADDARCAR
jgi:hypothetical protein